MAKPELKFYSTGSPYKVVEQTDEATTLRVLVTTIGSEDQKDLGAEFFTPDTYFGDDIVKTRYGTYGHALNHERNPYANQKDLFLGPATFVEQDDAGRWFDFEIKRSNAYHDYILQLNEKGLLGASTQCLPGTKQIDADTGRIDTWIESEVAVLVDPMDPRTIGKAMVIAKGLNLDVEELLKWNRAPGLTEEQREAEKAAIMKEAGLEEAAEAPVAEKTPATETVSDDPASDEPSLAEQIKAMFEEADEELTPEMKLLKAMAASQVEMAKTIDNLKASMNIVVDIWGQLDQPPEQATDISLVDLLNRLKEMPEIVKKNAADTQELRTAMKTFAEVVADRLKIKVDSAVKSREAMSDLERLLADETEQEEETSSSRKGNGGRRIASYIPDNAPGGN